MLKVRYAVQADADLRDIFDYTFETWGLRQADRYTALILEAVARLAQSPTLLGRPGRNSLKEFTPTTHSGM